MKSNSTFFETKRSQLSFFFRKPNAIFPEKLKVFLAIFYFEIPILSTSPI